MGEGVFYIFTEWVPGGSLEGVVNKFTRLPVVLIKNYTYQILQGTLSGPLWKLQAKRWLQLAATVALIIT